MKKIGLTLLTYNRLSYLRQSIEALNKANWGGANFKLVVDDGSTEEGYEEYLKTLPSLGINVYTKDKNLGIANSKNAGLRTMINNKCEHLFLMEDDIIMKSKNTCLHYINYANDHTIFHMNFGLHGPLNKGKGYNFENVWVYPDCVGAFSYYTKEVIETVGYMDENFMNAWEHVEQTMRIAEANYTTPFWRFADHPISGKMLEEIPDSIDNSSIRIRDDWASNIEKGKQYFLKKYGRGFPPRPKI